MTVYDNRDEYGLCTVAKEVTEDGFELRIEGDHNTYYLTFYLDQGKMEKIKEGSTYWGYSDLEEYKYVYQFGDVYRRYYNEDYQLMYEEESGYTPGTYYYTYDDAGHLIRKEGMREERNYLLENTYSEKGNLILSVETNGDSVDREEYTDDGTYEFDKEGTLWECKFAEDGTLLQKTTVWGTTWKEYDANGNVIKRGNVQGSYKKYQEYQVVNDDLLLFFLHISQNSDVVNP